MGLFRKKCAYCNNVVEKGKEIFKDVKVPGFIGTSPKAFCCSNHVNNYEKEVEEHMKKSKSEGSCCG